MQDTFNVKGIPTTIGYVSFIGDPVASNSPLVSLLEKQGAVFYVKTNVPQTLFVRFRQLQVLGGRHSADDTAQAPDSNNNIFGRTLNPHNLTLTAGGSSGGEGALMAMRGSVLGVGSDMAGSIRIPAMCNGVYGFKPTEHRVPYYGQARPDKAGYPGPIFPVAGPIGQSARDLQFFMKTIIGAEPWKIDHSSPLIPWRVLEPKTSPLRIGYIPECTSCKVTSAIKQTMEEARLLLQRAGHNVVELKKFPELQNAHDLSYRLFDTDNSQTGLQHIKDSGEPMVEATVDLNTPPPGGRKEHRLDDLYAENAGRLEIMREWHRIWHENGLDIILLPGFTNTAVPHDTMRSSPYMVMWNLVNVSGTWLWLSFATDF